MSIDLYRRARLTELRHPLKALLKELCFIADEGGGNVYPSVPKLARWLGLTSRGVQKCLDKLEELSFVSRPPRAQRLGGRHGQVVHYGVNLGVLPELPPEQDSPVHRSSNERVNTIHPTGEQNVVTGEHGSRTGEHGSDKRPERPKAKDQERRAPSKMNGNGQNAAADTLSAYTLDQLRVIEKQCLYRKESVPAAVLDEIERRTM